MTFFLIFFFRTVMYVCIHKQVKQHFFFFACDFSIKYYILVIIIIKKVSFLGRNITFYTTKNIYLVITIHIYIYSHQLRKKYNKKKYIKI